MQDSTFQDELERRLELFDSPESEESLLPDLPALDLWIAILGIALLSVGLAWWGYPA